MLEITSKDNARLKTARAARDGSEKQLIFVEGLRLAEELAATNLEITEYFFTTEFARAERSALLLKKLRSFHGAIISSQLLRSISDTKTPPGIIVLAKKPETGKNVFLNKSPRLSKGGGNKDSTALARASVNFLLVVLHQLNNPSNIGAILRTAEAAGASGVVITANSADPFAPKSLRSAMGSAFRLPLWINAEFGEVIEFCRSRQIKTVCAELNAERMHTEIDWTVARALIIGQEANGLAPDEIAQTDDRVKIPMQPPVESLNAAVACGVILYEVARQRQLAG